MASKWTKVLLRLALGIAFLSAVADRVGLWPSDVSAWGNMDSFLAYMEILAPWVPEALVSPLGWAISIVEALMGVALILGIKTRLSAQISAALLFIFALSMTFTSGLKGALDYSVFSAATAALALSFFDSKTLELDQIWSREIEPNS